MTSLGDDVTDLRRMTYHVGASTWSLNDRDQQSAENPKEPTVYFTQSTHFIAR